MNFSKRLYVVGLFLISVLALNGCVGMGMDMALVRGQEKLGVGDNGLVITTVRIANKNKPGFQPTISKTFIMQESPTRKLLEFDVKDDPFKSVENEYNEYLFSFSLKPGNYDLFHILGSYQLPIVMYAHCSAAFSAPFIVKQGVVSYLGNIQATIVERKGDKDRRAGPMKPFIDQSLAGFSNGTFEISSIDRYEEDVASYQSEYPALRGIKIEKQIVPLSTSN